MGTAEVIPGVSGGTIAFITGIYERLLDAIRSVNPTLIGTFRKEGFGGFWKAIDGTFLLQLVVGMGVGIVFAVTVVSHMLENYPPVIWAFFFGLIIASVLYIGRQVTRWRPLEIALLVIGAVVAFGLAMISPTEGSSHLGMVFVAGMIAICALILPGISGSFMLLMMGMYTLIVKDTIKPVLKFDFTNLPIFITFAVGALVGLLTFSHLVSWTFKRYRNPTLAVMTGFMVGSLFKIWPWQNRVRGLTEEGASTTDWDLMDKVLEATHVLPSAYVKPSLMLWAALAAVIGFVLVFALDKLGDAEEKSL